MDLWNFSLHRPTHQGEKSRGETVQERNVRIPSRAHSKTRIIRVSITRLIQGIGCNSFIFQRVSRHCLKYLRQRKQILKIYVLCTQKQCSAKQTKTQDRLKEK